MVVNPPHQRQIATTDGTSPTAQIQYARDGVIHVSSLFTPSEITTIRETFTKQVELDPTFARHDKHISSEDILARYPRFVQPHRHMEVEAGRLARKTIIDARLLQVVNNLIGPANAAQSMLYFKPPTARGQALHQDNLFLQSHPETCLAAWIAIDDCDEENGALIVIPGSHKNDILCLEDSDPNESFSVSTVRLPKDTPINRVQTTMKAGDVLFFHGNLIHGSLPNTSVDRFRRSLIFHYIPQNSVEVAKFYQPLISPSGEEIAIVESEGGGACGEFRPSEGH
jgi:phytanoyl-CoA hydroxylase